MPLWALPPLQTAVPPTRPPAATSANPPTLPQEGDKKKKDKGQKDKLERSVLCFPPEIAPVKCALLSLDMRVARDEKYEEMSRALASALSAKGISSKRDDSGVAIGRRYARSDELGIPFGVTFDFDTFTDNCVTIRERDSCTQVPSPLQHLPQCSAALHKPQPRASTLCSPLPPSTTVHVFVVLHNPSQRSRRSQPGLLLTNRLGTGAEAAGGGGGGTKRLGQIFFRAFGQSKIFIFFGTFGAN